MNTFESFLDDIVIKGYHLGVIAGGPTSGNHNPKLPDNSLAYLMELLEQGYDRVEWVGSDRDKEEGEICEYYDSHRTTWDLASFLNMHKESSKRNDIEITAAQLYEDMSDDDKLKVLNSPLSAYKYAKSQKFKNVPLEVVDVISEDVGWTEAYINGFLNNNKTEEVPSTLVDTILSNLTTEVDFVGHILHYFGYQDNTPMRFFDAIGDSKTVDSLIEEKPKFIGEPNLDHDAPIYSHSHVQCGCMLYCYRSDNPSDGVFVGTQGTI